MGLQHPKPPQRDHLADKSCLSNTGDRHSKHVTLLRFYERPNDVPHNRLVTRHDDRFASFIGYVAVSLVHDVQWIRPILDQISKGKRSALPAPGAGRIPCRIAAKGPSGFAGCSLADAQPLGDRPGRRRSRVAFCRAALRRDSSRRCSSTCSGWVAAHRSGSNASRSVSPALRRSSTSRR